MKIIKLKFSGLYRSKNKLTKGRVWQYRFLDRVIRNEKELENYLDYIHYNPVKHGQVTNPHKYSHSSLVYFREQGYYNSDWGTTGSLDLDGEFGE